MTETTWWASIIGVVALLIRQWLAEKSTRQKTEKKDEALQEDSARKDKALQEIHVLVNQRLTDALDQIGELQRLVIQLMGRQALSGAEQDAVLGKPEMARGAAETQQT